MIATPPTVEVALPATTTPCSLTVLTASRGTASKKLIPDAPGRPMRDPEPSLAISAVRVEHVQVAGLAGLREFLQRVTPKQALVHGIPKGSQPRDVFPLVTTAQLTTKPGAIARTLDFLTTLLASACSCSTSIRTPPPRSRL